MKTGSSSNSLFYKYLYFFFQPDSKESACNAGEPGSFPGSGRSPWRREWQPTLVFLSGEFLGQRSLAGYNPWGRNELDTTEQHTHTHTHTHFFFLPEISRWTSLSPQEKRHPAPVFTCGAEESTFPASNLPRDATTTPPARHVNKPTVVLLLRLNPTPPASHLPPAPSPPAPFLKCCFLTCPGPSPSSSHPPLHP